MLKKKGKGNRERRGVNNRAEDEREYRKRVVQIDI